MHRLALRNATAASSFSTAAAASTAPLHVKTPLVRSEPLSRHLGAEVFLKMDCMQPPGSFKIRGIGVTIRRAVDAGARHVVSSSGGNAGLAAAYGARELGVPATVVLPTTTPEWVHGRLQSFGAEVIVHGGVWDEADRRARELVEEKSGAYVHPFAQESTWDGHATVIDELAEQLPGGKAPDAIVTCVGGGGLLMGILKGLEAHGWLGTTRVLACETDGAASLAKSLEAGELITLPAITSIAKSLGALTVGREIFEHCKALGPKQVRPWVTTDAAAISACVQLAGHHRVLVEPACGAAVAAVTERSEELAGCGVVVVEVCGGALVDLAALNAWAIELGVPLSV